VLGQVAAAPRRVHHLAGVVLASLLGRGSTPLPAPTLIKQYDFTNTNEPEPDRARKIVPNSIVRAGGRGLVRALLQAPLCYVAGGKPTGTLKDLSAWCATRRPGLNLHFAKTGTQVTEDSDATVDAWVTGGLQFASGAAYSYVVVVGTGSAREPWARNLHAAQVAVPLVDALLTDLEAEATGKKRAPIVPAKKTPAAAAAKKPARLTSN
jgi:penicillin-binding protein 1A